MCFRGVAKKTNISETVAPVRAHVVVDNVDHDHEPGSRRTGSTTTTAELRNKLQIDVGASYAPDKNKVCFET